MEKTAEGKYLKDDASNYDKDAYKKPAVTVDIAVCTIIDNTLKILLIKRKHPPYREMWAIPGGFVNLPDNETLEETARRELLEETNLKDIYLEQLKTYGDPGRDPRMRIITVTYYALVPYDQVEMIKAGDDAKEAVWFPIRALPEMAFDHAKVIADLVVRLEGKISYSPIAFQLLPLQFTWTELQQVYEIIINKKLITPNFRRKIKAMYEIVEHKDKKKLSSAGKPPRLLSFIKEKDVFD